MRIRHTVIFTFYETTTQEQIDEVINRLNAMGEYLKREVGVTDWVVAKHFPETFKERRAHLLQDGIFPSLEALGRHADSNEHKRVVELTPKVCDWMTVDTIVPEALSFSESSFRQLAEADGITHISTGVAVLKNKKILIVRRAAADYLGGQYELPGGGVDKGENIVDSAIREVKEETGLTVSKVLAVFDGFDYTTDRKPRVRQINFLVEVEDGDVRLNPSEHDEFQWADSNTDLDSLMTANMKACVTEAIRLAG